MDVGRTFMVRKDVGRTFMVRDGCRADLYGPPAGHKCMAYGALRDNQMDHAAYLYLCAAADIGGCGRRSRTPSRWVLRSRDRSSILLRESTCDHRAFRNAVLCFAGVRARRLRARLGCARPANT